MKGSEYIAARGAITVIGMAAAGGIIAALALWIVPWAVGLFPAAGIMAFGIGIVVIVGACIALARCLGYALTRFDEWTAENGGIED